MCLNCWVEYGRPTAFSEKVMDAVSLIKQVYDHSCVGGGLHIVVDDWNLDDDSLKFCADWINQPQYTTDNTAERLIAEQTCINALRELTESERATALAIFDGFIGRNKNI